MRPAPERTIPSPELEPEFTLPDRERGVEHCKGKPNRVELAKQQKRRHSRWLWLAPVWCGIVLGVVVGILPGVERFIVYAILFSTVTIGFYFKWVKDS